MVEIDERFRLTLPKDVRASFKVSKGEKLYVVSAGDVLIIKKLPSDPFKELDEVLGGFKFDRAARRRAEKWLLGQA